jgi:hypothetical protein
VRESASQSPTPIRTSSLAHKLDAPSTFGHREPGLSWDGFNITGDRKSMDAVRAALQSEGIEHELRAEIGCLRSAWRCWKNRFLAVQAEAGLHRQETMTQHVAHWVSDEFAHFARGSEVAGEGARCFGGRRVRKRPHINTDAWIAPTALS